MRPFLKRLKRHISKLSTSHVDAQSFPLLHSEFTQTELMNIRRHFPLKKFFILGFGRSGKTLLARLIRLHPEVHCNWHAYIYRDIARALATPALEEWLERENNHWTHGQNLTVSLLRVVSDYIMEREANRLGKSIVGDESPNKLGGVGIRNMHAIFPDAYLLHVIRDGRDVLLWRRLREFVYFPQELSRVDLAIRNSCRRDASPFINRQRSLFTPSWLKTAAAAWERSVRTTDTVARELYKDKYQLLHFEDLVSNPIDSIFKVWSFLGAGHDYSDLEQLILEEKHKDPDARWREEEDPVLVRNLKPGLAGGWRRMFTTEDVRLFERVAGQELAKWGYEVISDTQ